MYVRVFSLLYFSNLPSSGVDNLNCCDVVLWWSTFFLFLSKHSFVLFILDNIWVVFFLISMGGFWAVTGIGKHQTSLATLLAPLTPDPVFGLPLMQMAGKGGRAQKRGSAGLLGFQASPLTSLAPPPVATWRLHWGELWAVIWYGRKTRSVCACADVHVLMFSVTSGWFTQ